MSDEWPSKAEQEGLHEHGGGFRDPASGRFAFPEGWTDDDSGLRAYERREQQEEAEEARKRQIEALLQPRPHNYRDDLDSHDAPRLAIEATTSTPARTIEPGSEPLCPELFSYPEGWTDGDSNLAIRENRIQQEQLRKMYPTPPPLELEATTSTPARTIEPGQEVEGLTIQEAAAAYGVSTTTIRRLIALGKGKAPKLSAVKVTGPKGVEYRIQPAALEALGYKVKVTQSGAVLTAARANLEAETLEVERIRREAAEQRSADLTQNLTDLREVIAKLPKALEAPAPRRRWFGKK